MKCDKNQNKFMACICRTIQINIFTIKIEYIENFVA